LYQQCVKHFRLAGDIAGGDNPDFDPGYSGDGRDGDNE
jgi:hypothetical protein